MLRRTKLFSALVSSILLLAITMGDAAAGWMLCRSDPLVILSNGVIMDISADIGTLPFNVQKVEYDLWLPNGVTVVATISTPTWLTTIETFNVHNGSPDGEYRTRTKVKTRFGGASVTANSLLLSVQGLTLDMESVNGVERVPIFVTVYAP